MTDFSVGSLVRARGREWVVLPESTAETDLLVLRPLDGTDARGDDLDDISAGDWNQAIRELVTFGEVERKGERRGARYRVVEGAP